MIIPLEERFQRLRPLQSGGNLLLIATALLGCLVSYRLLQTSLRVFSWESSIPIVSFLPSEQQSKVFSLGKDNEQVLGHPFPKPTSFAPSSAEAASAAPVVAYSVAVTSCPNETGWRGRIGLTDGAAILKHSVHLNSIRTPSSGSRYDYKFYAFVHPSAMDCAPALKALGFEIVPKEAPVELGEIDNQEYAKIIKGSGCCGHKEFMKLYSFTLTEHPIVFSMDMDTIVLKPLDHLYDILLSSSSVSTTSHYDIQHAQWNRTVRHPIQAFFVRDYNMNLDLRPPDKVSIQGGMLIHKPNHTIFEEFRDLITTGDFKAGRGWTEHGWGGTQVGNGGADRYQGLVSYYYSGLHPTTAVELNHCLYDQMVDRNKLQGNKKCRTGVTNGDCPDCRKTNITEIHSAHFTMCKKPWLCIDNSTLMERWNYWRTAHDLCMRLHWAWHGIRRNLENSNFTEVVTVEAIPQESSASDFRFYGHCRKDPSAKFGYSYIPLQL